jgi:mono/diheme cytochrome c family protein
VSDDAKDDLFKDWPLPPLLGEPEPREIHEIHRGILEREKLEPQEGLEPAPWWVWAVSVVLIFAMGFYLGRYSGSFIPVAHQLEQKPGVVQAASAQPAAQGDVIFSSICLPCHQANGAGLAGKYPPLAGSEWVAKDASIAARIVLNGLEGPIRVKGEGFSNQMPALRDQLADDEIAAVLTYVRSSFGNKSGPVTAETVAKMRKEAAGQGPWSAEKLLALEAAK